MFLKKYLLFIVILAAPLFGMEEQPVVKKKSGLKRNQKYWNNRLVRAVRNEREADVKKCLDKGADPNAQYIDNANALQQAVILEHAGICQLLLDHGADPNVYLAPVRATYGFTRRKSHENFWPLIIAVQCGNIDICRMLLRAGVNVNDQTSTGATALHFAAQARNEELCELLISAGADANIKTNDGITALHLVGWHLRKGFPYGEDKLQQEASVEKVWRMLIDAGARVNEKDSSEAFDRTIYQCLVSCKRAEDKLHSVLIDAGIDLSVLEIIQGEPFGITKKIYEKSSKSYLFWTITLCPDLVHTIVMAPSARQSLSGYEIAKNTLLCFKRNFPFLARDLRYLILSLVPEIGDFMVRRRLKGLKNPVEFIPATVEALMRSTIPRLECERLKAIQETYLTEEECDSYEGNELFAEQMKENIMKRLAQPLLLCNNPKEALGSEHKDRIQLLEDEWVGSCFDINNAQNSSQDNDEEEKNN